MHHVRPDIDLRRETVKQEEQHHDDAARTDRGQAHDETYGEADDRHPGETLHGRRTIRDSIFDVFLQEQHRGNHDEQYAYCHLDKGVHPVSVEEADVDQQLDSSEGAGNASQRQRDDDLPAHRSILQVEQSGGDFREELEYRVGTDGHDRRIAQAEDQHGEHENTTPHPGHADEDADDEANQNFGRQYGHSWFPWCLTFLTSLFT